LICFVLFCLKAFQVTQNHLDHSLLSIKKGPSRPGFAVQQIESISWEEIGGLEDVKVSL